MLRAVSGVRKGNPAVVGEYLDMRDAWHVVPALERLLQEPLKQWLVPSF